MGVGSLGQHHARVYASLPGAKLVGVCDRDPKRAKEIAEKFDCQVFEDAVLLAQACEAISIVVPTDLHAKVAIPIIECGCHILIEKPICAGLEEAETVLEASKKHGVLVQVGHIEHFNPVMSYLEESVRNPLYITADRLAPYNVRGTEVGVVLDLMIHDIGIIQQLVRKPIERIDAVGVNVLSKSEDIANARIVFENGCVANINTSRVSSKKVREIRVFQSNGYLSLNFMEQTGHLVTRADGTLQKEAIPLEKDEPLKLELQSFMDCVRSENDPKVSGLAGKSALEVAIKITDMIQSHLRRVEGY